MGRTEKSDAQKLLGYGGAKHVGQCFCEVIVFEMALFFLFLYNL